MTKVGFHFQFSILNSVFMVNLIKCTAADTAQVIEIGRITFYDTFIETNSEETILQYLERGFNFEKIKNELLDTNSIFYFAKIDDQVVGYLKVNFAEAQTELHDNSSLEIERIYIRKEYFGKGVANILFDKALEIAKENNLQYLWLGVWEQNFRALRFYEKLGFQKFDTHVFMMGPNAQTDFLMKLEIK